ncbi:hypothetical protein ALNOE001_04460 [Candidatus Methanobinarius endosymbioticus]|uniref:Uncharacterized protein n=1 Tax=Candidatus Methanobinarius endosymbioticus TaxID=2006182 RepID=A0A366MD64_9EURY|nr:hypothetical protein ALNOE001_04460 [Candidatus Methanobinarius endosymbioticus]
MKKIYNLISLVLTVFLITLGGIFLFESFNNNNSITSAVVVDINENNNTTNKTVHSNIL